MTSAKSAGRIVGILLLLHLTAGLMVPFIMLDRVRGAAGFLANAASKSAELRAAVLLLFVGSTFCMAVAIAALPVFRRYSSALAFWLLALGVAGFSLQAVDNAHLLSILSLSQEYAKAGAARADVFEGLGIVVLSARKWAHYSFLLVVGSWIFLLFSLLYRFRLVPRVLGALGMIGAILQITGVSLRGLLGYSPETRLAMPLAPIYVTLAVWLIVKGFDERYRPSQVKDVAIEAAGA